MSRSIRRSMAVLIGIILVLSVFCVTRADAASKGVKSIKNVNSGIRVTWYEEEGQSGYHVYRKAETSTRWNLVATVKGSDNLKWTDKSTINGKRYRYKVVSFKGKKEKSNSAYKTIYRVKTPRITKLYNIGNKSFQIRTNKNPRITGYQELVYMLLQL